MSCLKYLMFDSKVMSLFTIHNISYFIQYLLYIVNAHKDVDKVVVVINSQRNCMCTTNIDSNLQLETS